MVAEGRGGVGRRRLAGGDEPDPHAAQGGGMEAFQDRPVADVRVDDVDPFAGVVDGRLDRVADRVVAGPRHVPEDRRRDAHRGVVGDVQRGRREPAVQVLVRDRAALVAPARREHELELGDDRTGDPAHDVVEALVVVVVLDPAAADVGDRGHR